MNASEAPTTTRKKHGPLFWVLISVASLLLLVIIVGGGVAYFGFRAAQQITGLDTETMKKYPSYAASRLIVLANPDNVIISEDKENGEIRFRSKKTGEESITKVDPVTQRVTTVPANPRLTPEAQSPETK
jgi:hypothetical protein